MLTVPPGEVEAEERREQRHRDRDRHQERRAEPAQEQPQHDDRERDAETEVVADHLDGTMDVGGLVVCLPEHEARAGERSFGERRRRGLEPLHHLQDVHADLAVGVHRDGPRAVGEDEALAVGERDLDVRDVAQPHREPVAPLQDQLPEVPRLERAGEPQRVAPLADAHVAARDVLVGAGQTGRGRELDAEARGLVGVEGDAHLALAPAVDLGARDPGHALEPGLHDLLGVLLVALDVARVALPGLRHEPRDGAAVAADGVDDRLVGVLGVARHAVEAVEHLDEPAPQIVPDHELDGHLALAALGLGDDAAHAGQPAQHLLLRLDDLRLDLLGRRGPPPGADGDLRPLDLGRELDGEAGQADRAEQEDEQHRHQGGGPVRQREARPDHCDGSAFTTRTGCPGRRRSPPQVTTRSPGARRDRITPKAPRSRPAPAVRGAGARRRGPPRGRRGEARPDHPEGSAFTIRTGCPGRRRSPPRVTTRSPGAMPSTSMSSSWAIPGTTATRSARPFSSTR